MDAIAKTFRYLDAEEVAAQASGQEQGGQEMKLPEPTASPRPSWPASRSLVAIVLASALLAGCSA